jgi:hypothetical protein
MGIPMLKREDSANLLYQSGFDIFFDGLRFGILTL